MSGLAGKVALITGGTKGIGRATAIALVQAGAKVAVVYASDDTSATRLLDELGSPNALAIRADASSTEGIEHMASTTMQYFGRMDLLVLCAGTSPMGTLAAATEDEFDKAIRLNVKSPLFTAQKCTPLMGQGSRIVFISSSLCHYSGVGAEWLVYCACKGAIEQMVRVLARDLASREITVNAVAPGPVDGDHFRKGKTEAAIKNLLDSSPSGRLCTADEVADTIVFLCSTQSRWMSGQVIRVDGAMT